MKSKRTKRDPTIGRMAETEQRIEDCQALGGGIQMIAVHDETGWRVQLHHHFIIPGGMECSVVEGQARYVTRQLAHEHGRALYNMLDQVLGLHEHAPDCNTRKAAGTT